MTPTQNYQASQTIERLLEAVQAEVESLKSNFKQAASDQLSESNLQGARDLIDEVDRLEKAARLLRKAEEEIYIAASKLFGDFDAQAKDANGLRSLSSLVTEGLRDMSALSLNAAVTAGIVNRGEKMRISLENGTTFETVVDPKTCRLIERGRIAEFYRIENVNPPVDVYMRETSPGNWLLFSANSEEARKASEQLMRELSDRRSIDGLSEKKSEPDSPTTGKPQDKLFRIQIRWTTEDGEPEEMIEREKASDAWVQYVESLVARRGRAFLQRLTATHLTGRGPVVSKNPELDYRNGSGKPYTSHPLPSFADYHVLTHSSTAEKRRWIAELMVLAGLPKKSVAVGGFNK